MISKINYNDKSSFGQIHFTDEALKLLNNRKISWRLKEELAQLQMAHRDINVDLFFDRASKPKRGIKIYKNFLTCRLNNKNESTKFKETFITKLLTGPIGFIKSLAKLANKMHTQNQNLENLRNSLK